MNIPLMKTLDRTLGRVLAALLPRRRSGVMPAWPRRILFIRPGGIGDAVLLIAAIERLHRIYPEAMIEVLAEGRNAGVFELCPHVVRVWRYDRPWEFLALLVDRQFDCIIDTEQWHALTAIVSRFLRAPMVAGFATNKREKFYTNAVPYSHDDYEVESFLHLLALMGGDTTDGAVGPPFLVPPEEAHVAARKLLAPLTGKTFVTIFPGASIPERRWGAERFAALAKALAVQGFAAVILGGAGDRTEGNVIIAGLPGINLAGRTTLAEAAAVMMAGRLLVSGDSGLLHIGYGLGIPTVGLFGPGIAKKWAPRGPMHREINRNRPCSPCTRFGTTPPCPHGAACLSAISIEEVLDAAIELLLENAAS